MYVFYADKRDLEDVDTFFAAFLTAQEECTPLSRYLSRGMPSAHLTHLSPSLSSLFVAAPAGTISCLCKMTGGSGGDGQQQITEIRQQNKHAPMTIYSTRLSTFPFSSP